MNKTINKISKEIFDIKNIHHEMIKYISMLVLSGLFLFGWFIKEEMVGSFEIFMFCSLLVGYFAAILYIFLKSDGYFQIGQMIIIFEIMLVLLTNDAKWLYTAIPTAFVIFFFVIDVTMLYIKKLKGENNGRR